MSRSAVLRICCTLLCLCFGTRQSGAAIVSSTLSASADAVFRVSSDASTSSKAADTVSALAFSDNSYSYSENAYSFDAGSGLLTAEMVLITEKYSSSRRGGDHSASSSLTFDFEIDSDTQFEIQGSWGFNQASTSGTADQLSFTLEGPSGTVANAFTAINSGNNAETLSATGLLSAGAYRLTLQAELNERITRRDFATAGMTIDRFQLTEVSAIPEPGYVAFLACGSMVILCRRRRSLSV